MRLIGFPAVHPVNTGWTARAGFYHIKNLLLRNHSFNPQDQHFPLDGAILVSAIASAITLARPMYVIMKFLFRKRVP